MKTRSYISTNRAQNVQARRNRVHKGMLLVIAFAIFLSQPVLAFTRYPIDVDALKAKTAEDTFALRITKKVVADGVKSGVMSGRDMLTLTVENTGSDAASKLVVLLVCYDGDDNAAILLSPESLVSSSFGPKKREISVLTFEDTLVEPGASIPLNIPCDHSNFAGAQAIVAQYTNEAGQEITNPDYEDWQELALGNPTHILD